jgi:hypothetical protein
MCPSCNNHNFASRMMCKQCNAPKPGGFGAAGQPVANAFQAGGNIGSGHDIRPGDWLCPDPTCGNHNFASRNECKRCGVPKGAQISKTGMRPGDWLCIQCLNHNFANRDSCNKCQAARGFESDNAPRPQASPQMREGDWMCKCGAHNFASRLNCFKCNEPKQ